MQKRPKTTRIPLIGETIDVVETDNIQLKGVRGKVIDETKNTIMIETTKGTKTLVKDQITIMIKNRTINGKQISGRIEARIKQ